MCIIITIEEENNKERKGLVNPFDADEYEIGIDFFDDLGF